MLNGVYDSSKSPEDQGVSEEALRFGIEKLEHHAQGIHDIGKLAVSMSSEVDLAA